MLQPKVTDVKPLPEHQLLLTFETAEQKLFDVRPYISGSWFEKLKDNDYFNTVRVSGNTVEWAGGQDIAPHELYEQSVMSNNETI